MQNRNAIRKVLVKLFGAELAVATVLGRRLAITSHGVAEVAVLDDEAAEVVQQRRDHEFVVSSFVLCQGRALKGMHELTHRLFTILAVLAVLEPL